MTDMRVTTEPGGPQILTSRKPGPRENGVPVAVGARDERVDAGMAGDMSERYERRDDVRAALVANSCPREKERSRAMQKISPSLWFDPGRGGRELLRLPVR